MKHSRNQQFQRSMVKQKRAATRFFLCVLSCFYVTACFSPDDVNSEYQQRMQRCEQYVDEARERCLRGQNITIDEFKKDYREFEKDTDKQDKGEK